MKNSILFFNPDYHCSFFYRDQFRNLGWKADIFVMPGYPEKLLYSDKEVIRPPSMRGSSNVITFINKLLLLWTIIALLSRHTHLLFYGKLPVFGIESLAGLNRHFGSGFSIVLSAAKLFRCKVIYLPSGCADEETRESFSKLDNGNVCANCGWGPACDDNLNRHNFDRVRRYADMMIGTGALDTSQFEASHLKYKSIDLDLWTPDLVVPEEYLLPPTKNLRILHSFYSKGREEGGLNIKGSPFVLEAIDRLREEGHAVEYVFLNDIPSRLMRFYQVQADIVVEQLIYGWWGSTGVEALALGKPLVCYLRPSWKSFFLKTFPEYKELPIVEADTRTIYDVLKELVVNHEFRRDRAVASRRFAEAHLDPRRNAKEMSERLLKL